MSEYQRYEWAAIDHALSRAEVDAVKSLSSHISVTSTDALVEYHWGDFKHDAIEVLTEYFDAFLYYANWGSRQLAFRYPHGGIDRAAIEPYLVEMLCAFTPSKHYDILTLDLSEMEAGDYVLDVELKPLLAMHREIRDGDLRGLYIGWLGVQKVLGDDFDSEQSPPVPPGLDSLTAAQQALVEFLEIDPYSVKAAAEQSSNNPTPEMLQTRAETLTAEHEHAENERRKRERIAQLNALVGQEDRLWQEIETLLQRPISSN